MAKVASGQKSSVKIRASWPMLRDLLSGAVCSIDTPYPNEGLNPVAEFQVKRTRT